MGYGSLTFDKADYAKTLAATLAYFLSLQRDAVGLLTFDQVISDYIQPRYRPGHLRRLIVALERSREAVGQISLSRWSKSQRRFASAA